MTDDIDRANDQMEAQLSAALTIRKPVPQFTGHCHWCDEEVGAGAFCSSDCREMHEMEEKMKTIRGRP